MDQSFMYKGDETKLFDNDKVEQAEADGWFDNRGDAHKTEGTLSPAQSELKIALQKEVDEKLAAGSGALTTDASGSGAVTGKI